MKPSRKKNEGGLGIVVVLMALMVLGSVAGAMVLISSGHSLNAHANLRGEEALYAARAGALIKLAQVRSGDHSKTHGNLSTDRLTYDAMVFDETSSQRNVPQGCLLVEATGSVIEPTTGRTLRNRKVSILAQLTGSRWQHAAFGHTQVRVKAGSYTDAWDSDNPDLDPDDLDHSKASIGTNNHHGGVVIEDRTAVVIGWDQAYLPASSKKQKKGKKDRSDVSGGPHADIYGPPGSDENLVVRQKSGESLSNIIKNAVKQAFNGRGVVYRNFVPAAQETHLEPVVLPNLDPGTAGSPDSGTYNSVVLSNATSGNEIPPGAYHDLRIEGGEAVLDVSHLEPGGTAEYLFRGVHLTNGALVIKQPPAVEQYLANAGDWPDFEDAPKPVTVKVYIDTGVGANVDPEAGVHMEGGSVINPSTKPIHLQFLIAGEGNNTLEAKGGRGKDKLAPEAFYVAYAPQAKVKIKEGELYGSVVADLVELDGDKDALKNSDKLPAVIHYDLSLLNDEELNLATIRILSTRYD